MMAYHVYWIRASCIHFDSIQATVSALKLDYTYHVVQVSLKLEQMKWIQRLQVLKCFNHIMHCRLAHSTGHIFRRLDSWFHRQSLAK
jgi:hypothetical protein